MNTYEVKGGISVFATGGHQKKGPFGKTGFSKIEKNTIFQISIRSPNRDFEKTPFFSSNLPNGPWVQSTPYYWGINLYGGSTSIPSSAICFVFRFRRFRYFR